MCDKGHIIVEMLHGVVPPKICSLQAGIFEIDFRTQDIHIYHCPCNKGCRNAAEACNRCEKKLFQPQERMVSHQCTESVSSIRIVSKECGEHGKRPCKAEVKDERTQTIIVLHESKSQQYVINEEHLIKKRRECPLEEKKNRTQSQQTEAVSGKQLQCSVQKTEMKVAKHTQCSVSVSQASKLQQTSERSEWGHNLDNRWRCRNVEEICKGQKIEDLREPARFKMDQCAKQLCSPTQSRFDCPKTNPCRPCEEGVFTKCNLDMPVCDSENVVEECSKRANCRDIIKSIIGCKEEKIENESSDSD